MKLKLLLCSILVLLLALPIAALPPTKSSTGTSYSATIDNTTAIDVNRIYMFVTNHGNFGRDLSGVFGYDYGTWFPYTGNPDDIANNVNSAGDKSPNYASGLWMGGKVGTSTRVVISEYASEYVPGPMVGGTFVTDNAEFRVYKLYKDSLKDNPNTDYEEYMLYAVGQGAPVWDADQYEVDTTVVPWDSTLVAEAGEPRMIGEQMLWSVYNDADVSNHEEMLTDELGLEVKQTMFGFDREGSLGNMVFVRYRIYNKGANTIDSLFISLWCDPDLGNAGDDLVGCDTNLSLGYVYNSVPEDNQYVGDVPPSMGFDFFQGPLINTGDPADTALMWDTKWPGYVNMGMVSFNKYINGTDPDDFTEVYAYQKGLDAKTGLPYIYNGDTLLYQHSGDPVNDTGDVDIAPADRRWMQTTGPITFAPGDSTEIIAAIIVGQGSSNFNSISVLKDLDAFAQKLYENGFNPPEPPAKPKVTVTRLTGEIALSWDDASVKSPGDFEFEGFTVWQGASASGPWTELVTYDVINDKSSILIDTLTDAYSGTLQPQVMRKILNTGLGYVYSTSKDAIGGGDLDNLTPYYYRVTAFSYPFTDGSDTLFVDGDGVAVPKGDRFLESATVVTVVPQNPLAGIHANASGNDTLVYTHSGPSDGAIIPIVVDPFAITGHTYSVIFEEVTPVDIVWHVVDRTTGDTLLADQVNQTGNDEYLVVDGILVKVTGPELLGKDWEYEAATPPNISPVALADHPAYAGNNRWFTGGDHGGELLFGGVFMEPNFWGETTVGPADIPIIEIRWRPMQSYTDLNSDGRFTIGEPYTVDNPSLTQSAFMYSGFSSGDYLGFFPVPFTAWDVTDPGSPRQINCVIRDRDQNNAWNLHFDTTDALLPNGGDLRFNYTMFPTTDYDATGTLYGDGTGGTIGWWDDYAAAWTIWLDERGTSRGMLAEECILRLIPPSINLSADTFTFNTADFAPTMTQTEADLENIKAVPNPFYLNGAYDPSPGQYAIHFHNLPATCTIDIYNLIGEHIETIEKDDPSSNFATWDVLTKQGLPVASGIYIYVVEAPGYGRKIGKMAVFVEQEVLRIY